MSEIGLKSILTALGNVLQIRDVRQAPSELDTSSVKVVAGLDPGMFGLQQHQLFGASLSLVGVASAVWTPVGPPQDSVGWADTNRFSNNGDRETVIIGMRCRVTYDVAGAGADAGNMMGLEFHRQAAGNIVSSVAESTFRNWAQVTGTDLIFDWTFPWYQNPYVHASDPDTFPRGGAIMSMPYIYVPAGSAFRISLTKLTGAFWPANTSWSCTAFAVSCPKGMRPPGM